LLWQAGCEIKYIPELSGHVPLRDKYQETTVEGVYVAGDAAGVEEASSAMVEGRIAGYAAALSLGLGKGQAEELIEEAIKELEELREGPVGEKIRRGLKKAIIEKTKVTEGGVEVC